LRILREMDKIETLNKRLKEVVEKFKTIKDCGVDEELLEIYLEKKTKLSKKKVKEVLNNMEEFYNKLVKGSILEKLNEGT
jgi:tRNA A22 N-methylase